jgi:ribosomal-protein-alanine N-acetyltransferase
MMSGLRLLEINRAVFETLRSGEDLFRATYSARISGVVELLEDVLNQSLKHLHDVPREPPFGCYLTVDNNESIVVGTCGFTSGPDENDSVEIAYYTFPAYEGRGYATAAAREMIRLADASRQVRCVFAHTLPERNASCRILEKIGMRLAGEVVHPADGRVWRWELPLA